MPSRMTLPGLSQTGSGLMPMPTPGGVPVVMTSPGCMAHELADIGDDIGDAEDHRPGRTVLVALAIDLEPHGEVLRIGDFVAGHEPGADWAEGVGALALVPGAAALGLEMALGDVVADAVAGDVIEGVRLVDIAGFLADDHGQLDFPVRLDRVLGMITSSLGPMMALVAFMKMIGSSGILAPVSAAWSA